MSRGWGIIAGGLLWMATASLLYAAGVFNGVGYYILCFMGGCLVCEGIYRLRRRPGSPRPGKCTVVFKDGEGGMVIEVTMDPPVPADGTLTPAQLCGMLAVLDVKRRLHGPAEPGPADDKV